MHNYRIEAIPMSQKSICENYSKVYWVSYCGLQHLLTFMEPEGKNYSRKLGLNCSFYIFHCMDTVIATGYRFNFKRNIPHIPYEMTRKYDGLALEVLKGNEPQPDKSLKLFGLIEEMFKEFEKTLKEKTNK